MKNEKALFLGPKAENQELYESLIIEIIRDSCFLRKNFHPEDTSLIKERDKLDVDFQETVAHTKEQLQLILAELKKGVPWYHPRYIGHMFGDLMLPAVIGYFSTILYNPNNVVGEVSTATTRMELEYINELCQMVGYRECKSFSGNQAWGHLCSGGTSANIEALWVARNMKYYPLSVKLAYHFHPEELDFVGKIDIRFHAGKIMDLSYNQLFNIPVEDILEIRDSIDAKSKENSNIEKIIKEYFVEKLGIYGIHNLINEIFKSNEEQLQLPRVYIAKSMHYSWQKAMDILGLGQGQLIYVDIDEGYRMNFESLKNGFKSDIPTLAIIGILGSSKQGSIDPIDKIIEFRNEMQKSQKISFIVHIDAAYGGYFASLLRSQSSHQDNTQDVLEFLCTPAKKNNKTQIELFKSNDTSTINENWVDKIGAISHSDSITIDPHKMGYIPYPAGSILFRDTRVKEFISYLPSYLNKPDDESDLSTAFLGQWTLEGSRPGAAATACYLSFKVMPLNRNSHGLLIRNSVQAASCFWETIETFNKNNRLRNGFKIVPTYTPETNIVSYVLSAPNIIKETKYLNMLTTGLFNKFTITGKSIIPAQNFMVAKESFDYNSIPKGSLLAKCEIDESIETNTNDDVIILSSVFMNPLSIYLEKDFYLNFFKEMVSAADIILLDIMLQILNDNNNGERLKVLWIENEIEIEAIRKLIHFNQNFGRFLDINLVTNHSEYDKALRGNYNIYIFDLNLEDKVHNLYEFSKVQKSLSFVSKVDKIDHGKILFYSKFFSNPVTKDLVLDDMKNYFDFCDYQIIPKMDIPTDIRRIIKGIFEIMQI